MKERLHNTLIVFERTIVRQHQCSAALRYTPIHTKRCPCSKNKIYCFITIYIFAELYLNIKKSNKCSINIYGILSQLVWTQSAFVDKSYKVWLRATQLTFISGIYPLYPHFVFYYCQIWTVKLLYKLEAFLTNICWTSVSNLYHLKAVQSLTVGTINLAIEVSNTIVFNTSD